MKSKYQQRTFKKQKKMRGGYSYENNATEDAAVPSGGVLVGGVFAEWCGHCQRMHPGFKEVTKQLKKQHGGKLQVKEFSDKHNLDDINAILQKHGGKLDAVQGYPTTFLISGGKTKMYNGKTDFENDAEAKEGFKKWIEGHLQQSGGCSGCNSGIQHGGYDFSKKHKKKSINRRTRSKSRNRSRSRSVSKRIN